MALSTESLTTCILLRAFFEKLQLESFSHCKACTSKKLVLFRFLSESETNLAQKGFLVFVHFLSSGVTTLPDLWGAKLDFGLRRNISFLHWSFSLTVNCFEIKSPKCHFFAEVQQMSIKTIQSCCYKTIKKRSKVRFALPASELVEKTEIIDCSFKRKWTLIILAILLWIFAIFEFLCN